MSAWTRSLKRLVRRLTGVEAVQEQMRLLLEQSALISGVCQTNQLLLRSKYREMLRSGRELPQLQDAEFRVYSRNGEDGIIHYVFSLIGEANRKCIEICAGDGIECNTANLIINHGWSGLLFDGNEQLVTRGREFYRRSNDTARWPPTFVHAWVTAENVNELISRHRFEGEIDLLSLDIDGMDWWIWRAIDVVSPRMVILEYQDCWGPDAAVTVPYRPDFVADFDQDGVPSYSGASLNAFVKLGKTKGYRLIGCQRYGYNAIFIRNDVAADLFPEVSASACFTHAKNRWAMEHRLPKVKDMKWLEVDEELLNHF